MRRAILIVMDGCGIGALPDASGYGEEDPVSNTLPHVAEAVGGLHLPALERIGLGCIAPIKGLSGTGAVGAWGRSAIASVGKDSVTGHWEMMGIVIERPFPTYPNGFPKTLIEDFEHAIGRKILCNSAGSGTEIIKQYGREHIDTGYPILYTSADSVFQIAAHEVIIPLDELYRICEIARELLVAPNNVLRVIARPFIGDTPENYHRTENRRDFPLAPPPHSLLNFLKETGVSSHGIGVVCDLFPTSLFTRAQRTQSNAAHLSAIKSALNAGQESFLFANCEDFDMLYGHRNDPAGFAWALSEFDASLSDILIGLRPDDLLIITADHGNDPTTKSTDHSREYVPVLAYGKAVRRNAGFLSRMTLADIAATVALWLELPWKGVGRPLEIFA